MSVLRWVFGRRGALRERVTVYVPGTRDRNQPLERHEVEDLVREVAASLSRLFGGATAQEARGFWEGEDGSLIAESISVVYSLSPRVSRQQRAAVLALAQELKERLGQEAVLIGIGDEHYFV